MRKIIIGFLILLTISSCARLEDFTINRDIFEYIAGYKMNGIYNVEVIGGHTIRIEEGGRFSLSKFDITNYEATFYVKKIHGVGIKFYFRTNVWDFPSKKGISMELRKDEVRIYENDDLVYVNEEYFVDKDYRKIKIQNHGKNIKIWIDCAEIYVVETMMPCTEHIIVESIGVSEALITKMNIELSQGYSEVIEFQ